MMATGNGAMNTSDPPWIDAILVVLLVVGNLLALPLWFHLLTGPLAGLRSLVAGFRLRLPSFGRRHGPWPWPWAGRGRGRRPADSRDGLR